MQIPIDVPDGVSGNWRVETFCVSEEESKAQHLRAMFNYGRGRLPAGTYKRLYRGKVLVMSNTPDEISDFMPFVSNASGKILVNGLGLGVLLKALLQRSEVTEITVIEKSFDVIKLVSKSYSDPRLTIINADAFKYNPPKDKKYDAVWHDIWDYISSDNIAEMKKLHRKYAHRASKQASWCRTECERQKAKEAVK